MKMREVEVIIYKDKKKAIYIREKFCKGCGICIHFCPRNVLEFQKKVNENGHHPPYPKYLDKCTGCNICTLLCPDYAIWINKNLSLNKY
jgi:2-oxoglutarate ferredoxin oxidoreductase subunit delta